MKFRKLFTVILALSCVLNNFAYLSISNYKVVIYLYVLKYILKVEEMAQVVDYLSRYHKDKSLSLIIHVKARCVSMYFQCWGRGAR